jgi:hypothetical protein
MIELLVKIKRRVAVGKQQGQVALTASGQRFRVRYVPTACPMIAG